MTVINAFSKFAYVILLKTKTVLNTLEPILAGNKMKYLQTDNGNEYYNTYLQASLKKYKVKHYSMYSGKKASIVERLNRTMKTLMYRVFSEQGHYKWLALLPKSVVVYKDSVHPTIGMKPREVNKSNERIVLEQIRKTRLYQLKTKPPKFKADRKHKMTFAKGYTLSWINEIFTVHSVQTTTIPVRYLLKDHTGKVLKGGFYEHEVSKSNVGDVYLVVKVLQRKDDSVCMYVGLDLRKTRHLDTQEGFAVTKMRYVPLYRLYSSACYDDIMSTVTLKDIVLHPADKQYINGSTRIEIERMGDIVSVYDNWRKVIDRITRFGLSKIVTDDGFDNYKECVWQIPILRQDMILVCVGVSCPIIVLI